MEGSFRLPDRMTLMTKPQFSIRGMLLATTGFGLAAWLAPFIPVTGERDPYAVAVTFLVAALAGPPAFSIVGAAFGQRSNSPWIGGMVGLIVGTAFVLLLSRVIWI